jgi:hypothetical protein
MDYSEWIRYGLEKGFCGPPVCETHDGLPLTKWEEDEFYEGHDPCVPILRLTSDAQEQKDIAENHSASQWRAEPFYEA